MLQIITETISIQDYLSLQAELRYRFNLYSLLYPFIHLFFRHLSDTCIALSNGQQTTFSCRD